MLKQYYGYTTIMIDNIVVIASEFAVYAVDVVKSVLDIKFKQFGLQQQQL